MATRIEVRAGDAEDSIVLAEPTETLKEAKRRARYLASDAYARAAEMSRPFGFVAVYADGESVFEAARRPTIEPGQEYFLPYRR